MKILTGSYAWLHTSLGPVFLAATGKGLCVLGWNQTKSALLKLLRQRFPGVVWTESPRALKSQAAALEKFLAGKTRRFNPPLDLRGAAFQLKVWNALRQVPFGKTISYEQLAIRSGHPRAIRAVANACGQNPVAVAVPCHRIIRKDGSLGGYRSGLNRKKFLLKLEAG